MVCAQGQMKWFEKSQKYPTYDLTHKQPETPNQEIFPLQT